MDETRNVEILRLKKELDIFYDYFAPKIEKKAAGLLSGAEKVLNSDYGRPVSGKHEYYTVTALGYDSDAESDTEEKRKDTLLKSMKLFAAESALSDEGFSIILERSGDEVRYSIGTVAGRNGLLSHLRSSYGIASLSEKSYAEQSGFTYKQNAVIGRYDSKEEDVSESVDADTVYNWVDMITSSHIGADYRVKADFVKIQQSELENRYNNLSGKYTELSNYKQSGWNIGTNTGDNTAGSVLVKSAGKNWGVSNQASGEQTYIRTEQALKRIACELRRLEIAVKSIGCGAVISVEAKDAEICDLLCRIIGGCLTNEGFSVKWEEQSGRISTVFPLQELCLVAQLPSKSFAGLSIEKNMNLPFPKIPDGGVPVGRILHNKTGVFNFTIPNEQFNRHAFVCGMTGSGKTNTMHKLLEDINLPFLIIEPVKSEYRNLRAVFPGMHIYNMQAGSKNALSINPF
jgi:hypothetical protein